MKAWHQKSLFESNFPLRVFTTDVTEFPPHWHEAVEIVYVLGETLSIGVNNEIHTLYKNDILLINSGDVHYFLPQNKAVNRIILLFEMHFIEPFSDTFKDKRFAQTVFLKSGYFNSQNKFDIHIVLKKHILEIFREFENKSEGYRFILKARLYDILVTLLRHTSLLTISSFEKAKRQNRLERLRQVFNYVEQNYERPISLQEIASVANFSVFYFTRFFKDTTGMTFIQYMNNFRVTKTEDLLLQTNDTITEVAFKSGFGSIKTFNRVFRNIKGCSPSQYRKAISEK